MDVAPITTAERAAAEFPSQLATTVIRVPTDGADELPDAGPLFSDQASRERLAAVPSSADPDRAHG